MNQNHEHDRPSDSGVWSALQMELRDHVPFSVSAVAIGLVFAGLVCYLVPESQSTAHDGHGHSGTSPLFHLFHPVHTFFSAAATTAMFWRYDRRAIKAVMVGMVGAIGVCGVSDIGMPHIAQMMMGWDAELHICVVEDPGLVFPFAIVGVLVGLGAAAGVSRSTLFSHALHVLTSTLASIFYLIAPFGGLDWIDELGRIFIFVVAAVMIPCCLSDIVFPLLMTKDARAQAMAAHHGH